MLPTFVIIGAMKCGTSSLHRYLSLHPEICMSSIKETNFFIAEKNYARGRPWYESLFNKRAHQYGEASPSYAKWPRFQGVPQRMHALLPDARLIYLVRDPVARMISQYAHNVASNNETRPIDEALRLPAATHYLAPSQYRTQLEAFLEFYPLQRTLVLSSEELLIERRQTLRRVFEFLGVDSSYQNAKFDVKYHDTGAKFRKLVRPYFPSRLLARLGVTRSAKPPLQPQRQLTDETRHILSDLLRPEIDGFRQLTGQRFEQWSI